MEEAASAWREVVKANPEDSAAWASLGLSLSRLQKYEDASAAYRKALALNPKLPGVQLNLGLAEFKLNNLQAAVAPLRAAVIENPNNMQAQTLLGLSYYGTGQFANAVKHLVLASKADPANAELHGILAQSCLSAKEYDCALNEFAWILKRDPDSASAHMLTGEALDGLGRTPEAIAEFTLAAKAASNAPDVNFGLGYLYWKMRRYDEAASAFEKELSVDPKNAQALAYLGDVEMKRENPEKAQGHLEQAIALRSDIFIAQLDMGVILMQQKKYPEALVALQGAAKLDPEQPEIHYRLGRLYQAMGQGDAAQKEFAKVQQLHKKEEERVADKMSGVATPPK